MEKTRISYCQLCQRDFVVGETVYHAKIDNTIVCDFCAQIHKDVSAREYWPEPGCWVVKRVDAKGLPPVAVGFYGPGEDAFTAVCYCFMQEQAELICDVLISRCTPDF